MLRPSVHRCLGPVPYLAVASAVTFFVSAMDPSLGCMNSHTNGEIGVLSISPVCKRQRTCSMPTPTATRAADSSHQKGSDRRPLADGNNGNASNKCKKTPMVSAKRGSKRKHDPPKGGDDDEPDGDPPGPHHVQEERNINRTPWALPCSGVA